MSQSNCYLQSSLKIETSQNSKNKDQLYEENQIENKFICSICINIIQECVTLMNCGHHFCGSCVTQLIESNHDQCPNCRTDFSHIIKDREIDNMIRIKIKQYPKLQERSIQEQANLRQINLLNNKIQSKNQVQEILQCIRRGNELIKKKQFDLALQQYDQALSINDQQSLLNSQKALMMVLLKKFEQALIYINRAIEIDNQFSEYYNQKAFILIKLKHYDLSIQMSKESIQIDTIQNDMAYFQIALALSYQFNYIECIKYIQVAIDLNSNNYFYYDLQAYGYYKLQKYQQCIEVYDKVLEIAPQKVSSYKYQAESYFQLQEYDKSLICCLKAKQLNQQYYYQQNMHEIQNKSYKKLQNHQNECILNFLIKMN